MDIDDLNFEYGKLIYKALSAFPGMSRHEAILYANAVLKNKKGETTTFVFSDNKPIVVRINGEFKLKRTQ